MGRFTVGGPGPCPSCGSAGADVVPGAAGSVVNSLQCHGCGLTSPLHPAAVRADWASTCPDPSDTARTSPDPTSGAAVEAELRAALARSAGEVVFLREAADIVDKTNALLIDERRELRAEIKAMKGQLHRAMSTIGDLLAVNEALIVGAHIRTKLGQNKC